MDVKTLETQFESHLSTWREDEKAALELLKIVGDLRFDRSIEIILFRRDIYDSRPTEVMNDHLFAKNYSKQPITIQMSVEIAKAISKLDLAPSRIDLGKLATQWLSSEESWDNIDHFVAEELANFIGEEAKAAKVITPRDVVLYGFGRIGRLAARCLIQMMGRGEQLRLKAIVLRQKNKKNPYEELLKRASLLRKDSIHGKFRGTISVDQENNQLIVNSCRVQIIFANSPEDIDYTEYSIKDAILIDNTGAWRDKEGLSRHLRPGIKQVLFTAPGKGIKNIVHGINQKDLNFQEDTIFCAASCTTNAIAPVLKVLHDKLGVNNGHLETIHAYTNAQNLLDNYNAKERRGSAAAINMVITSTGAADAVSKVIPTLAGKLTGSAIRVPTPDGSLAVMTLNVAKETTVSEINEMMRQASLHGNLVEQIKYSISKEFVSSDVIGSAAASIFDAPSTKVGKDGKTITVYVWYDNEYGYTRQVLRLAKYAAQVRRYRYY
ncbi:MAG: NAD-dependent glyceraldehyde-3-phosphate dehydrogenase (EC [uncultured Aureispira sp.]|uniref:NAD-dependent glyceraldehyde-3-phosphate dehydrogenase (EC) n=1 Tax=uncultured Aureispira sp. TaxID=1331704 RepID=A0A6S6SU89_9BACT|nr:MAG: NAD-dependent glyceraldehyde-3-phosphate dehydrogenase (EC [uncultured Aureispira sp.]